MKVSSLLVGLGAAWMVSAVIVAQAPPPAQEMHLKVLPKTWTRQQVNALMQTFTTSLGVQCSYCHSEDPNAPPPLPGQNPRLDYAADTKPEKETSREMIQLVMRLNEGFQSEVVSCFTCHRGKESPDFQPPDGWGRGNFSLSNAGPVVPTRGGAPRGGGPAPAAPPSN